MFGRTSSKGGELVIMSKADLKTTSMNIELYEYKRKVIAAILDSEDIIQGLNADCDPSELMYNNVFPFGVVAPVQSEAKCLITVEITMPQVSTVNYFFKDVLIVVTVICHNDLMRTDFGIPRHDYVSAKICELLNGSTEFGYGEIQLVSNTEGVFTEQHSGRVMRFKTQERNKDNLCF